MNSEKIGKALDYLINLKKYERTYTKDIQTLIDLASAYLAVEEPKEKETKKTDCISYEDYKLAKFGNFMYNQALHDSKLSMIKKLEGIEEIIRANGQYDEKFCVGLSDRLVIYPVQLSTAIKDHLTK